MPVGYQGTLSFSVATGNSTVIATVAYEVSWIFLNEGWGYGAKNPGTRPTDQRHSDELPTNDGHHGFQRQQSQGKPISP